MVWGCIDGKGPGPLYVVEGTMRRDQYKRVLNDVLLPYVSASGYNENSWTFQQDNAPCHTAKTIKNFMSSRNIPVLAWPGNSPDLSPIENVWYLLKSLVYKRSNPSKEILIKNIQEVWNGSPEIRQCIDLCLQSMPRRIKAVIKNKGGHTKY